MDDAQNSQTHPAETSPSGRDPLNNHLGLTVGYAEVLLHDPRLPPELHPLAAAALLGAEGAAAILTRLQRIARLEEGDLGEPGPIIDLDRSIGDAPSK